MSWEKIENHLFDKYCVEGEDKEICNLMEEHDKEIRNKAIDELCKEISKLLSGDTKHLEGEAYYKECAYYEVLKIAEQMKEVGVSKKENGWIPCSERMPEKSDAYLVTVPCLPNKNNVLKLFYHAQRGQWFSSANRIHNDVLAWLPLPEPYIVEQMKVE